MRFVLLCFFLLSLALAWLAWHPQVQIKQKSVRLKAPVLQDEAYRVLSAKLVWGQAVEAMAERLRQAGLQPQRIQRREKVSLMAFDDARRFRLRDEALVARDQWRQAGIEAELIHVDADHYGVALGRFYLSAYARQQEQRLRLTGLPYRSARRFLNVQTVRFVFASMSHEAAMALWKQLQALGIGAPILMREDDARAQLGSLPSD